MKNIEIDILRAHARELHEALKANHTELADWHFYEVTTRPGYNKSSGWHKTQSVLNQGTEIIQRLNRAQLDRDANP